MGRSILLVDDDPDILESLKVMFETELEGVRVLTATSGAAGLDVLGREQVDLIIADYRMPGMNGAEFLARARQRAPRAQRAVISAFPESALEAGRRAAGELAFFLPKPLDTQRLLSLAERSLGAA